jgi:hypothetical protein
MFVDFILDENGDALIQNGDFVIGDATNQYIMDTLQTEKGEYKATPQFGVGSSSFLNGPKDTQGKKQLILTQLKIASIPANDVNITQLPDGSFKIVPIV